MKRWGHVANIVKLSTGDKTIMQKPARRLRSEPVPVFNNRFAGALAKFGAAFLETSAIKNTSIKGTKREASFRDFIGERLPSRFGVASGEVVDQLNISSPQLDILIYDRTRNFSFSDDEIHVLPAEALLASIEIKSKLNAVEIERSCKAAQKLRKLQPFKKPLGGRDLGKNAQDGKLARYFHCVFAYDTDLSAENWLKAETQRFRNHTTEEEHLIDAVYVLNRGLLNLSWSKGRIETTQANAITSFYFSILNFIEREGARRDDTPYQEYASLLDGKWESLQ